MRYRVKYEWVVYIVWMHVEQWTLKYQFGISGKIRLSISISACLDIGHSILIVLNFIKKVGIFSNSTYLTIATEKVEEN